MNLNLVELCQVAPKWLVAREWAELPKLVTPNSKGIRRDMLIL